MPLQAFLTIMVACLAGGVAAVNQRQNIMGEVFGTAAIVVCGFTITVYALWPVTPNTALPLTLVILTTYLLVAWTHFVCSDEREKERERHRPNFDIEIHQVVFAGDQPPSHAMHIAVEMTIHNSGADSAARTWSPIVEFMDGIAISLPRLPSINLAVLVAQTCCSIQRRYREMANRGDGCSSLRPAPDYTTRATHRAG